jgi:toxin HigB-1
MIRSFADREAEALFHGRYARRLPANIQRVAQRKLRQLHAAEDLRDLAAPPGNRLEALRGGRTGQHSVRISPGEGRDQWRLCFVWKDGGAERVEIVDYHQG